MENTENSSWIQQSSIRVKWKTEMASACLHYLRGQLPGHWWKTKMFLAKDSCAVLHNTVGSLFYTFAVVLGRSCLREHTFLGKQNSREFHKSWVICLGCLSLLHLQYLSSTWHIISSQQIPSFLNE